MPGNSDYDSVLKTVLAWPKRDQAALVHAVVDGLVAAPLVRAEKPTPPPLPPVAPAPKPAAPIPPPAPVSVPAPKTQVVRAWVDETST